jgi:hypothetical protein
MGGALSATAPALPGLAKEGVPFAKEVAKGVPIAGGFVPQSEDMTRYEQEHPTTATLANVGGAVLSTLPAFAAAPAMGLGFLPTLGIQSTVAGGTMAGDQALRDALRPQTGQPSNDPSVVMRWLGLGSTGSRAADAGITGAGLNTVAAPVAAGVSRAVPVVSDAARRLEAWGVRNLTPGQRIGGAANEIGGIAENFPLSGFHTNRSQAIGSFNRAAEDQALQPLQIPEFQGHVPARLPDTVAPGYEGRRALGDIRDRAYDIARNGAPGEPPPEISLPRQQLEDTLALAAPASPSVTRQTFLNFHNTIDRHVMDRAAYMGPGTGNMVRIDGPGLQNSIQGLEQEAARALRRGGDGADLAEALHNARDNLVGIMRQQNPRMDARLAAADRFNTYYEELRNAGARTAVGGVEGLVSPEQLAQGGRGADISVAKTRTSEGTTRYGDFARTAQEAGIGPAEAPSRMAQLEALGGAGAAAFGVPGGKFLYPAFWAYNSGMGQRGANALLDNAEAIRAALSRGLPAGVYAAAAPGTGNDPLGSTR